MLTVRRRHAKFPQVTVFSLWRLARGVLCSPAMAVTTKPLSLTRMADHPRFLEVVVGRLLDLVVHSVEGIRDRFTTPRMRTTVH